MCTSLYNLSFYGMLIVAEKVHDLQWACVIKCQNKIKKHKCLKLHV